MGCAYWAGTVLDRVSYPNFALLFLAAYGVTFLSWIALALTREPPSVTTKQHIPFARFISELPTILRRDHKESFARFVSCTTIQLGMLANGFFIVYGIERFGIDGIFIGNLTVVLVATQAVMSLVWGYVADQAIRRCSLLRHSPWLRLLRLCCLRRRQSGWWLSMCCWASTPAPTMWLGSTSSSGSACLKIALPTSG